MYESIEELLKECEQREIPLWQPVLENEMSLTGRTEAQIYGDLERSWRVMTDSVKKALESPKKTAGNLISGSAKRQADYAKGKSVCGSFLNTVMAYALSGSEVNASMGRICAAPTAGSCGIMPSVLTALQEREHFSDEELYHALLVASGFGTVVVKNATVSGAEGGCQAECGTAAAITSAAVCYLYQGTPKQSADAFSLALMNCMGLVCDPVAGLVQVPCAQRNASEAVNAMIAADLTLAGMESVIPADEVVDAMGRVGEMMPSALKETTLGGIAAEPSAKKIASEINS